MWQYLKYYIKTGIVIKVLGKQFTNIKITLKIWMKLVVKRPNSKSQSVRTISLKTKELMEKL